MKKVKVVIKKIGEAPYKTEIDNTLKAQQTIVGGYIEAVGLAPNLFLICNEEGKLDGLKENFMAMSKSSRGIIDSIVGDVLFIQSDDEGETADISEENADKIIKSFESNELFIF